MRSEHDPVHVLGGLLGLRAELSCPSREDLIRSLEESFTTAGPRAKTVLLGPRLAGTSQAAKSVYVRLFTGQEARLPLYYDLDRFFPDAASLCRDHAAALVRQYLAFREKDPGLLGPAVVSGATVRRMVRERGDRAAGRLLAEVEAVLEEGAGAEAVRLALSTAARLAAEFPQGAVLILDHLHRTETLPWAAPAGLAELLAEILGSSAVAVLATGLRAPVERRFLGLPGAAGRMHVRVLDPPPPQEAARLFESLCRLHGVTCRLDALEDELARFRGIPFYMEAVIRRARERGRDLASAEDLLGVYREEVAYGDTARHLHALMNRAFPAPLAKRDALRLLTLPPLAAGRTVSVEEAARRLGMEEAAAAAITERLILEGFLEGEAGALRAAPDPVLSDVLDAVRRAWLSPPERSAPRSGADRPAPEVPILTELKAGADAHRLSFGLVLPMVTETELVAARALEQVAERADFPEEEIGRIRMALIEACINAFEHSRSRDGKIYITFTLDQEKLSVVVEDKGVSFDPAAVPAPGGSRPGRRGWGLELIKNLMDEVTFEDVPVGTRLRMVKYYPKAARGAARAG